MVVLSQTEVVINRRSALDVPWDRILFSTYSQMISTPGSNYQ